MFGLVFIVLCCHGAVSAWLYGYEEPSSNVIKNWDLENELTADDFQLSRCNGELFAGDSYTGTKSLKINARTHKDGSFQYFIPNDGSLIAGGSYYFSSFIKLLNNASTGYTTIDMNYMTYFSDGTTSKTYLGKLSYELAGDWKQLGGDIIISTLDWTYIKFYTSVYELDVDFLIDTVSLVHLPHDANWKETLQAQIDQHRKGDIVVRVTSGNHDHSKLRVKLNHTRHDFGFGTAVKAYKFASNSDIDLRYKNFVYDHFTWAVFENAMKWKPMEKSKGNIKTDDVDTSLQLLLEHNMTVRGHAIVWDVKTSNPDWLIAQDATQIKEDLWRRVNYVVSHFKGKLRQWDVCNEYTHKHYFENKLGNKDLIYEQFRESHKIDPDVALCLNDYQVVKTGQFTSAQANLAKDMLTRNVPIGCVGMQSHIKDMDIPVEALKKRVEISAAPGLPLAVTELSVHSLDDAVKARVLEEAFYVYFSNPAVETISLWGFAEGYSYANDMWLTTGSYFTPNAAGAKMLDLIHNTWSTQEDVAVTSSDMTQTVRGYYGTYTATLLSDDQVLGEKTFSFNKGTTGNVEFAL